MKVPLTHPSYHDIEKGVSRIAVAIANREIKIGKIIGLSRGGLLPAVIMSHIIQVPMIPIAYSSKKGNGDDKDHDNILPEISEYTILVIDDICDTGQTMNEVCSHYRKTHLIYTAALYVRETSYISPNFHWQIIKEKDPWICFPWEA